MVRGQEQELRIYLIPQTGTGLKVKSEKYERRPNREQNGPQQERVGNDRKFGISPVYVFSDIVKSPSRKQYYHNAQTKRHYTHVVRTRQMTHMLAEAGDCHESHLPYQNVKSFDDKTETDQ